MKSSKLTGSNRVGMSRCVLALLCCVGLSACRTIPVDVNEGRIQAETFSWMLGSAAATTPQGIDVNVQSAIEAFMAENGVRKVDKGGDITIGYMIILRTPVTTSTSSGYFGLGTEKEELLNLAHKRANKLYKAIEKNRNMDHRTINTAALVIDIVDTGSSELLYRNSAYRALLKNVTEKQRADRIRETVDEVFTGLKLSGQTNR
jgi:hypothetical protein